MKKVLALVMALVVVAALNMPAMATTPYIEDYRDVPMLATVEESSHSAPIIKYKWELPDDMPGYEDCEGTPEPGACSVYDEVQCPLVDGCIPNSVCEGTPTSCEQLTSLGQDKCEETAGCYWVKTQVLPVLSDDPGPKQMSAYIVIRDDDGRDDIGGVYIDVFHPEGYPECGSFKFEVEDCVRLDPVSDYTEIENAKIEAVSAGLITETDADEIDHEIFNIEDAYMYRCDYLMSYHQPCGKYRVEAWGVSQGQISDKLINYFEFICVTALDIDFSVIDFGNIKPSIEKPVTGDFDMNTPDHPTVKNEGNTEIKLGLHATPLVGTIPPMPKTIEDFDAKFLEEKLYFVASQEVWFTNALPLCTTEKITFSVHAPLDTPADSYSGDMTIYVEGGFWGSCG